MRLKFVLILGAIAALAILAAGCGGGSDSTSTSTTTTASRSSKATTTKSASESKSKSNGASKPLTESEFKIRINEICIQVPPGYERKLEELEKGGKKLSKVEANLKAAVPPLRAAIEEMEAVEPPAGKEQTLEEVISSLQAAADGLEEKPASKLSGPASPFAKFQEVTAQNGFTTCAGL